MHHVNVVCACFNYNKNDNKSTKIKNTKHVLDYYKNIKRFYINAQNYWSRNQGMDNSVFMHVLINFIFVFCLIYKTLKLLSLLLKRLLCV